MEAGGLAQGSHVEHQRSGGLDGGGCNWRLRRWVLPCGQWESCKVSEQGRDVIGVGVRKTSLTAERTDWW